MKKIYKNYWRFLQEGYDIGIEHDIIYGFPKWIERKFKMVDDLLDSI